MAEPLPGLALYEGVEEGLKLGQGGRLWALRTKPLLEGLLESLDLAAGGGVVRSAVLLEDPEWCSSVSNALRPRVPRRLPPDRRVGVHHAVVGQRRCRVSVQVSGLPEGRKQALHLR
jgi:hypothetical protein